MNVGDRLKTMTWKARVARAHHLQKSGPPTARHQRTAGPHSHISLSPLWLPLTPVTLTSKILWPSRLRLGALARLVFDRGGTNGDLSH
jgi:hypothetical protein